MEHIVHSWYNLNPKQICQYLDARSTYKIGVLIPFHNGGYCPSDAADRPQGLLYAPAIQVAMDYIKKDKTLNFNINLVWNDTYCDEFLSIKQQIWQLNNGVDVFVGPVHNCQTAANIASAFNKPMMSFACSDSQTIGNINTLAKTSLSIMHIYPPLMAVLKKFNWKKVAIVYQKDGSNWEHIYDYVHKKMNRHEKVTITLVEDHEVDYLKFHNNDYSHVRKSVKKISQKARIVILLTEHHLTVEYVLAAYEEKLIQTGEFVFICFQLNLQGTFKRSQMKWYFRGFSSISKLEEIMDAFGSVLIIQPRVGSYGFQTTDRYGKFSNKVKKLSLYPPFKGKGYIGCMVCKNSSQSNCSMQDCKTPLNESDVPVEAGNLYNAIREYVYALKKTLTKGEEPNGKNIIANLKGHTFDSVFGFKMTFDNSSNVIFNMTLLHQEYVNGTKEKSKCEPFDAMNPCKVMKELASFWLNEKNLDEQSYHGLKEKIAWYGGLGIPKDTPDCGFNNELCRNKKKSNKMTKIIGSVSGVLALLLLLLLFNIFRQYSMEKQLHSLLWKVDPSDISFPARRNSVISIESGVIGSFIHDSQSSSSEGKQYEATDNLLDNVIIDEDPLTIKYTTVGQFKGNYVAIKKLSKKSVDLSRIVLKELNLMREVRHDNLNPFIGACIEPGNICIVTSYCHKGSLQDILLNEDVNLDHMFILSLIYDITMGMTFLHSSDIKVHGNLKSSNCLVDSRWQLKIADYGLPVFKSKQIKPYSCEHAKYRDMLWKAPELLRSSVSSYCKGTQHGDVYSFAIILQEFHTRKGPYSHNYDDIRDIIEHVKATEFPPYRPVIPELIEKVEELREMAKECWNDIPHERPTFSELKKRVHRLLVNLKMKTNILDNMIYMMEKYADNLEDLVVERTGLLSEEKRKTDALLARMLPSSVAEQLKRGRSVEAESFQCVTIYFSDIVSFTELCAESTPLQVVTLLNDLYTLFDEIIREFDVYKVETIGDAYMVVSGLPQRNENLHASEISCMALRIRDSVLDFKIRHKPHHKLKLRIGIHSGPVVAGVVGRTMPRYCLFGDTVNTASRLESSGEALSIHISSNTNGILEKLGGFKTERRGEIPIKGKGSLITYWLLEANNDVPRSPHRQAIPPEPPLPIGPILMRELQNSNISLRGSMRGSFRNSPAILRNGLTHAATHDSPVIVRLKKVDDELLANGTHT
ncbi:atrial natriuretic peptide receptor 1-like isoform X4 [Xenia sp. Carnegie-2017]|uniref:atrial natriuretic peptide receptor 1-like isoform X4 n=1 Tax=Xenia sp. Carnegie-2017 TaxID=2897299 RepID=UPI001F039648|nr:atrial natriuretic peptide receptor 1-like isoform X4 [Xenia sp. Carnegie-2017]